MNDENINPELEEEDEEDSVPHLLIRDTQTTTLPAICVEFTDGGILDPDDIHAFSISSVTEVEQVPGSGFYGFATVDANMHNRRWYDIDKITINGNKCLLTAYDPIFKNTEERSFAADDTRMARLSVMIGLQMIRIPDISDTSDRVLRMEDSTAATVDGGLNG